MKRLFRIGTSIFSKSIFPVLTWILLSVTIAPEISNVFSLTYPIQFISLTLFYLFGSGANIKAKREKNDAAIQSGMFVGTFVFLLITTLLIVNINGYLSFFNVDVSFYRVLTIYAIFFEFLRYVLSIILEKLYFEAKEKIAYIISFLFNFTNFLIVVIVSLLTKNQIAIALSSLIPSTIFIFALFCSQLKKFKLDLNFLSNFKYESSGIVCCIVIFLTYFFSYGNAFQFGPEIILVITFTNLITDSQWDSFEAVSTTVKIDTSSGNYNHKTSTKNQIIYSMVVALSSILFFLIFFDIYKINLKIGLIFLFFNIVDMMLSPIYYGFDSFIQLEYSPTKNIINHLLGYAIRFSIGTFMRNEYCIIIAQIVSSLFMCIFSLYIRFAKYKIDKNGKLIRTDKKITV